MTSGSLGPNAVDLTECCSNLFTLAEINGLKWCKYTGNSCSLDSPLDDPVLVSFATALENNVLCSWRHAPPFVSQKLHEGMTCPESAKELWLFWYGDDPRTINIVDKHLKESDHGSWESGFPNEARVLLFKALHNTLERHLLSRDYVRVGKWFVNLDKSCAAEDKNQLFFSFAFCLQGESKICMTVDVKQLPGVRHLVPDDLTKAAALQGDFKVILGPYGISATLTGHSYQLNGVGVSKLVEEWKSFYPLHVVDDWTSVPEGIEHDVPVVVGVMVGNSFIKCPSHYVMISLDDEKTADCSGQPAFSTSSLFPMTPPASPFAPKTADEHKSRRPSTNPAHNKSQKAEMADAKVVACEVINDSWKDITATKSTNKSSGVSSAQGKSFGSNFKSDQEPLWNFKEPLGRKSCSCTSSSNISRSRVPTPARSPFGINRPSPSPGNQNNQSSLASKLKKDKEDKTKKPILPFHLRPLPTKFRPLVPASKGVPTCNVATHVADQNRQPNSHHQNEASTKSATNLQVTDSSDDHLRQNSKASVPLINNNHIIKNSKNDEDHLKGCPPVVTRLSDTFRSDRDRKPSTIDEDLYRGYRARSKPTQDIWKCYNLFTGDPKLKPRLPEDVLNLRDSQGLPLTTESVVSIPEDSGEVFTIETIETENYKNKRTSCEAPAAEIIVPPKRRRRSSSTSVSGSNKSRQESTSGAKPRTSRTNSSSKPQVPTPSPEPTVYHGETFEKDSFHQLPSLSNSYGRANGNSSGGSAASSPASTVSTVLPKASRPKSRRPSKKSQERSKAKETGAAVKQEPVEPLTPLITSPPTPRSSVSLRTEKDLQVTLSDLDKLFDSPDEDEEDSSKTRQPVLCLDDLSPPIHHGNDDSNSKTRTNVSTGPGVVSHADLARMFPTPPSLENHPPSPSTTSSADHYYPTNPPVACAPTPPEFAGHAATGYGDVVKNLKEERYDILASLKELPAIFEIPCRQDFLSSSSSFSPVKALPSSRLPPLHVADDMKYTPSSSVKSSLIKSDSSSLTTVVSFNSRRHSSTNSTTIPDLGHGSLTSVFTSQNSKLNVSSPSPKELVVERARSKYTPLGDNNSNLLNANLFLSDSFVNYFSDTSLEHTNVCICPIGDRKLTIRPLTMGKEPLGFTRNMDVCSCGLGLFEREKLRDHDGLFSADISSVESCVDDVGVSLDDRYCNNSTKSTAGTVVKKEPLVKDSGSECKHSDLFGTSNSASLVENLLDQFSSPLAAAATSERLARTDAGDEDTSGPLCLESAVGAENFSKNVVDFLFELKPVLQESLHKAIRWKTWEQLSSVQGPLSLKQLCQVNSKGSLNATDPARIPRVIVGHDNEWLSMSPFALQYWEKLFLEPYTSSRDVAYVVLAPDNDTTIANIKCYFKELSSIYETCLLGRHVPVTKVSSITKVLRDGILRVGQTSSTKYGKNAVSSWFSKYDNTSDGPRLKLFAQVCKFELGPFLEKLARERHLVTQDKNDENSNKNPADLASSSTTSDQVPGVRDEERRPPSIVVYIVNPFDEAEDRGVRRESYFALLRSFSEMTSALPQKVRNRLVLEIIPLHQVTQVDAYQKTKGSHVSFVKLIKATAFSVFSRCRLVLQYPYISRKHTGFWAAPSHYQPTKNQSSEKSYNRVFSPPYILATPTKLIHNVDTVETPADLTLHKESSNLLFCCYALSHDHRWLLASCTNDTGLIMETFVTVVESVSSISSKPRRSRTRTKALKRLWEFCQGVTSCMIAPWRMVIGKLGKFSRNELRDWDEIIRNHSTGDVAEPCEACISSQSHTRFQSVSVLSLHNETSLRIHLAKVSTPFSSYREPNTAIVESVSRPRISTTFIVINVESSQTSHLSLLGGMRDLGTKGDLGGPELLMTEPSTEDDDEIPMMPLFNSIANIFPPSKPHLHQDLQNASSHDRPSSAPMLTDSVSSPFVPIGLHSPHQSQSAGSDDQSDQEKQLGFPLAHGRVFTTAPLGPVLKPFSHDKDLDRNCPVVLKASLLVHHVDESSRHGNHVLSSAVYTSVLRYILEQYDALSWLSVDSVSKDRTSCLPVHYTTLSQMTDAFNELLR